MTPAGLQGNICASFVRSACSRHISPALREALVYRSLLCSSKAGFTGAEAYRVGPLSQCACCGVLGRPRPARRSHASVMRRQARRGGISIGHPAPPVHELTPYTAAHVDRRGVLAALQQAALGLRHYSQARERGLRWRRRGPSLRWPSARSCCLRYEGSCPVQWRPARFPALRTPAPPLQNRRPSAAFARRRPRPRSPPQAPAPAVFVDKNTKVICQGITGKNGTFHTEQARTAARASSAAGLAQRARALRRRRAAARVAAGPGGAGSSAAPRALNPASAPPAPSAAGHHVWHPDGRRRDAQKGRHHAPRPPHFQHRRRGQGRDGRQRVGDLRAAAVCGGRGARGGGGRAGSGGLHHRGHPAARHGGPRGKMDTWRTVGTRA